ncbi:MAG: oligosaccharide flippase family protein [Patescibacteria group bacterium]|nr:oligosaccharide flippase family protein [Patescibacteria group bacterium]
MIKKLFASLSKPTSRNILINTLGNYLNVFFTALLAFLLVRVMDPVEYGILSVLLGVIYVLTNILDFGTAANIYSYLPVLVEQQTSRVYVFLKTIFYFQTLLSLLIVGLLIVFFPSVDRYLLKTSASWEQLALTAISVLFFIWQNYIVNALNATGNFFFSNLTINISNLVKTGVILGLYQLNLINVATVMATFGIVSPVIVFIFLIIKKFSIVKKILTSAVLRRELRFSYTFGIFVASQFYNLGSRIDLFLLSFFFPQSPQVGYYSLSQKVILTVLASIIAITQVLSPSFAKISTRHQARKEFLNGLFYLLIPAFLFLSLIFIPDRIFEFFFTAKYQESTSITKALAWPFVIFVLLHLPLIFIIHTAKKTRPLLLSNLSFFLIMTGTSFWLIPRIGWLAPVIAYTLSFLMMLAILTSSTIKEYQKLPENNKRATFPDFDKQKKDFQEGRRRSLVQPHRAQE